MLLAKISLVTRESHNQGDSKVDKLGSLNDTFGNELAGKDTTENINENSFDLRVSVKDLESSLNLVNVGTTTDVEEVSRRTTIKLDDVHSAHSKTSTVNEAADVTIESNVSKSSLDGLFFMEINILTGD